MRSRPIHARQPTGHYSRNPPERIANRRVLTGKRISNCQLIDRLSVLHVFGVDNCASGSHCSSDNQTIINRKPVTFSHVETKLMVSIPMA